MKHWRRAVPWVGLAFGLLLVHLTVDLGAVWAQLRAADPAWLLAAFLVNASQPPTIAEKVRHWVRVAGREVSYRTSLSAVLTSTAVNAVIPARGGDFVRALILADEKGSVPVFIGAILLERMGDVFTLGLLSLVAATLGGVSIATPLALGACVASAGVTVAMAFGRHLPWKPELGERIGRAARGIRTAPGQAVAGLVWAALCWINSVVVIGLCLRAVGVDVGILPVLRAGPVAILIGILPVTVGGIGTRDMALVTLLGAPEADRVVAGAFLFTILAVWGQGLLGLPSLRKHLARVSGA